MFPRAHIAQGKVPGALTKARARCPCCGEPVEVPHDLPPWNMEGGKERWPRFDCPHCEEHLCAADYLGKPFVVRRHRTHDCPKGYGFMDCDW